MEGVERRLGGVGDGVGGIRDGGVDVDVDVDGDVVGGIRSRFPTVSTQLSLPDG